jgi:hypothetical protein
MVKKLYIPRLVDDKDLKTLEGTHLDSQWITNYINYDCDIYDKDTNEFILSFRKKILKKSAIAWEHLRGFAKSSRGRGQSAGIIDKSSNYWKKRNLINTKGIATGYLKDDGNPSKMKVNNPVFSQPIGYFGASRGLQGPLPCRLSHYTKADLNGYEKGLPYIEEIAQNYLYMNYKAYIHQQNRANLKLEYIIPYTPFSTFTINRNFRTSLHKDKGDYGGIACLSVLEEGQYSGGCLMIPAYGIGVDMRMDDMLIADVHQYHCNSEIFTTYDQNTHNNNMKRSFNDNIEVGVKGDDWKFTRISFVCYLRENIIHC